MKAMPHLDHHATGQQLYAIRDQLIRLRLPYPKTSKAQRALTRAVRALDHLRCQLDQQFATDAPQAFDTRAYYPGGQYRAPQTSDHNQTSERALDAACEFEWHRWQAIESTRRGEYVAPF